MDNNSDAMICDDCSAKVDEVLEFCNNVTLLKNTNSTNVSFLLCNDESPLMCCCCLSTSRLKAKTALVPLLRRTTGIDVRDD